MSSLQERVAARRRELEQEKQFVLPLPGYEDIYAVRYRALPLEDEVKIQERNAELSDRDRVVAISSDQIINACVEFLEVKGKNEYASVEHKWTPAMARELFGAELPPEATARDAVLAVFSGPLGTARLVTHAAAYDGEHNKAMQGVHEKASGESRPSDEG